MQKTQVNQFLIKCPKVGICLLILSSLFFASCSISRHIPEGTYLLTKNNIQQDSTAKEKFSEVFTDELRGVIIQKPNFKFLKLFPIGLWLYYTHAGKNDTTKWDAWFRKTFGNEPVYLDYKLNEQSAIYLNNHLLKNGYFNSSVHPEVAFSGKKAQVTYHISTGELFHYGNIQYSIPDSTVALLLKKEERNSAFKSGNTIHMNHYTSEVSRIVRLLQSNGYALFQPYHVEKLKGDTTGSICNIQVRLTSNDAKKIYRRFQFGQVHFYDNYVVNDTLPDQPDYLYKNIHYFSKGKTKIDSNLLYHEVHIQENNWYDINKLDLTYQGLVNCGIYRLVILKNDIDSISGKINVNIFTIRAKSKTLGVDFDINNTTSDFSGNPANLLGVAASGYYQNRNMLNRSHSLKFSNEVSLELDNKINTFDFVSSLEYTLPHFTDYFTAADKVSKIYPSGKGILNRQFYKDLKDAGTSSFLFQYNYNELIRTYKTHSVNLAYGFRLKPAQGKAYIIRPLSLEFSKSTVLELAGNLSPVIQLARLRPQFYTGFLGTSFSYEYQKPVNRWNETYYNRIYTEYSGLEVLFLNQILNPSQNWVVKTAKQEVHFAKFIKGEYEYRYGKDYGNQRSFHWRVNSGLLLPIFPKDTNNLPFTKEFTVGGPSSMRAWRFRELGPGSFNYMGITSDKFISFGDIKFETNVEYRFPIWWRFYGALFLDVGNIWIFPGSHVADNVYLGQSGSTRMGLDFFKDLAIGSGMGIRFDYNYFVIRLDGGLKIKNNYKLTSTNSYFYDPRKWTLNQINLNLALGYPF